uniref:Secreted protein n=1 Tax=Salix viminalis TaxID=40686 RepID=A0A6N2MEF2_SALVM
MHLVLCFGILRIFFLFSIHSPPNLLETRKGWIIRFFGLFSGQILTVLQIEKHKVEKNNKVHAPILEAGKISLTGPDHKARRSRIERKKQRGNKNHKITNWALG